MNHGRGFDLAKAKTLNLSKSFRERWGQEHPGEKIVINPIQLELFDQERRIKNA